MFLNYLVLLLDKLLDVPNVFVIVNLRVGNSPHTRNRSSQRVSTMKLIAAKRKPRIAPHLLPHLYVAVSLFPIPKVPE